MTPQLLTVWQRFERYTAIKPTGRRGRCWLPAVRKGIRYPRRTVNPDRILDVVWGEIRRISRRRPKNRLLINDRRRYQMALWLIDNSYQGMNNKYAGKVVGLSFLKQFYASFSDRCRIKSAVTLILKQILDEQEL
jgi:hypothetical protein